LSAQSSGQTRRKPLLGAPSPVAAEAWYGGLKCGADHLPSVFAEVDHHRGFLLDPTPTIAPVAHGDAKLSGKARVGRKLRCKAPRFSGDVEKTTFRWTHITSSGAPTVDGRGRSYKVRKRDRGHRISCVVEASNDGGPAVATASQAVPR